MDVYEKVKDIIIELLEVDPEAVTPDASFRETLEADSLILAVGQDTDTAFLEKVPGIEFKLDGTVIVGENMMTGQALPVAGGICFY